MDDRLGGLSPPRQPADASPRRSSNSTRERALVAGSTLLLLLPFVGKPLHIDDPLFVWTARRILQAPLDFYGFEINWYDRVEPMAEVMKNPPLVAYWHAGVVWLAGFREVALHLGALLWAVAAALGAYALARRLSARPLLATLSGVVTPAFLVTATSLGSDIPMLALWLWAIALWVDGLDRRSHARLAAAGALCAAAALAKYFAVGLLPLLVVYSVARERRVSPRLLWLLLPLLPLGGYELATRAAYGHGLLLDAMSYSREVRNAIEARGDGLLGRLLVGLAFVGGATATPLLLGPWLWSRRAVLSGLAAAVVLAALSLVVGRLTGLALRGPNGVAWDAVLHVALLGLGGIALLALAVRDLALRRDADALLLALAVAGTLAFALVFNWTVNERSLLPLAPLGGLLGARALELPGRRLLTPRRAGLGAALAVAAFLALAVAWADWGLARAFQAAAERLASRHQTASGRRWCLGHWGFQYYLEAQGVRAVDLRTSRLEPGDVLFVPENSSGSNQVPQQAVTLLELLEVPPSYGLSVQSVRTLAAFHAAVRGPLPFRFGPVPPERFAAVRIERPLIGTSGALAPTPPGR